MPFFADTVFYVALLSLRDQHRGAALAAERATQQDVIVTSEAILVEVLALMSATGPHGRQRAVDFVKALLVDARTAVVPQTGDLFLAGLDRYERRLDKSYSLTDCMSMCICEERRITGVLTNDRHFVQEGFEILL